MTSAREEAGTERNKAVDRGEVDRVCCVSAFVVCAIQSLLSCVFFRPIAARIVREVDGDLREGVGEVGRDSGRRIGTLAGVARVRGKMDVASSTEGRTGGLVEDDG